MKSGSSISAPHPAVLVIPLETQMMDWDDLRFFLSISRSGSLSAASRSLHVAQSTVGRRLASLECSLGVRLLNRTPDGYVATAAGDDVRRHAERVEKEALTLERQVAGRDLRLAGSVRVTCAETIASSLVAPCLGSLQDSHPDITVELMATPRDPSLSMREADISIRLTLPEQHDLVVRRVGSLAFGLYASPGYLETHGTLAYDSGCLGHRFITQSDGIDDTTQTDWLAELASRARISMRTSSHAAALASARHGAGLACLVRVCADPEDGLVRLEPPLLTSPIPSEGIWLAVHKDNRDNPRIRVTLDHIARWVRLRGCQIEPVNARELELSPAN
jgi:DNA-binding transcriptional LysR family regulator